MCPDCQAEYDDPRNRRFHAQPVACHECGPQLSLLVDDRTIANRDNAIQIARSMILDGKIVAIKGIGGFHLACNPYDAGAVARLRARKLRSNKPFALMASDLGIIQKHAIVSPVAEMILRSREKPVVLIDRSTNSELDQAIAPGQSTLGFMLPYTPLHHLLLKAEAPFPDILVMTSANLSEEPIAYRDEDARTRLSPLADGILTHDRDINIRTDDSVSQYFMDLPYPVRRSRGYAPNPIQLPSDVGEILATGAELKNTFCLSRGSYGFVSHHIGDLENYETYEAFSEGIKHYERLFRIEPKILACDLHPDYLSTRYALKRAEEEQLPLFQIQHHHAHLAACIADNKYYSDQPVIGLCYDGTGYGTDGTIWGGEVLVGNYASFVRMYHLEPFLLPGSELAIRNPVRIALSLLWQFGLDWDESLPPVIATSNEERLALRTQLEKKLNSPITTSMGRLFDAISALIGVCQFTTYEAQAAVELQTIADPDEIGSYDINLSDDQIDIAPLVGGIYTDLVNGVSPAALSARFHNTLAEISLKVCQTASTTYDTQVVALSGGVWQNKLLLERTYQKLMQSGLQPLIHRQVPTNDGGISLGQLMIAAKLAKGM
jgi:hydrogenase maturation protein HypF